MRSILAGFFLIASAWCAHAGVLVELTDGTKLTVESHWSDGDQVHLVRGGVDMIVDKSKIKSMDEDAADPDGGGLGNAEARHDASEKSDVADAEGEAPAESDTADAQGEGEKGLGEMTADELQALHEEESNRILEAQQKRFTTLYGGGKTAEEKKAADKAFRAEQKRSSAIWLALEKAKKADTGEAPMVPKVEQPQ